MQARPRSVFSGKSCFPSQNYLFLRQKLVFPIQSRLSILGKTKKTIFVVWPQNFSSKPSFFFWSDFYSGRYPAQYDLGIVAQSLRSSQVRLHWNGDCWISAMPRDEPGGQLRAVKRPHKVQTLGRLRSRLALKEPGQRCHDFVIFLK